MSFPSAVYNKQQQQQQFSQMFKYVPLPVHVNRHSACLCSSLLRQATERFAFSHTHNLSRPDVVLCSSRFPKTCPHDPVPCYRRLCCRCCCHCCCMRT